MRIFTRSRYTQFGKKISWSAFSGCTSLEEIVIPDSVTEIGRDAFNGCTSLEGIVIPESVTKIGYCAFENCKNLSLITIPKVYSSIGDVLSGYSGDLVIKSIDNNYSYEDGLLIDKNNKELVLYQSKNKKLEIPNCIKEIGHAAFSGCTYLEGIVIPDSVEEIRSEAFKGCTSLQQIVIPESVTKIGYCAFNKYITIVYIQEET